MRRLYLTIYAFTSACLLVSAENNTAFHSRGAVYCWGNDSEHAVMYIKGNLKASGDDTHTSDITVGKSRIKLTGNLINDVDRGSDGTIFSNKLINATDIGTFEFCGTSAQSITTAGTTNLTIPSKLNNYINFPNLEINNSKHVNIDARLAVKTKNIDLVEGWLIVDSDVARAGVDGGVEVDEAQESVLSHLFVDGNINYHQDTWGSKNAEQRGFIQVNLQIPSESHLSQRSIVGFGSPFKKLYTDYFMFNTLLEPTAAGFLAKSPITDPKTPLEAGKGYVVGIDLRGTNPDSYPKLEDYENIDFEKRATDGYQFNRFAFSEYAPNNQVFGSNLAQDAYQLEVLNTSDVPFTLMQGYNYLSNPFTCPLSIEKLLGNDVARDTWKVNSDYSDAADIWNMVWVLEPNSMAEELPGNVYRSKYTYNYQVATNPGGTYINGEAQGGVTALAPLQMFVVYSNKATNTPMTIPASERVMGTTRFLRNAPVSNKRTDDFIIEFRDKDTKTTDRLSFVMRPQSDLPAYNNVDRLVSSSSEGKGDKPAQGDDFLQSYASQIYTKDAAGKKLTVQFLPLETTHRIQLYHIPSLHAQEVNILGQRIDTKLSTERMWLEDSKYNTKIEITPDMLYTTYCEPGDSRERFAIIFSNNDETGIEDQDEEGSSIYTYSKNSNIFVQGFTDKDFGSSVNLYDMNGRLLAQKNVNDENILLSENCASGVYLIKVNGRPNKTMKLIVQ